MSAWVCAGDPRTLLDPALGAGVFIESVAQDSDGRIGPRIDAFEIDAGLARQFKPPAGLDVTVRRQDFLRALILHRYDAIIANPPYVRHHEVSYDDSLWQRLDRDAGLRLSRATNLYGLFLVRIWSLLAERGRAAIIMPTEWLNADFGKPLKTMLLRENAIEAIICFDHECRVFESAMTTAAILLLRRGRRPRDGVRLTKIHDPEALRKFHLANVPPHSGPLDASSKWTPLFEAGGQSASGPVLGDVARCIRGIATGANAFFTLRPSEARRWRLSAKELCPCITKAPQVRCPILDTLRLADLRRTDERMLLLTPRKNHSPGLRAYLDHGRKQNIHRRYLPRNRPVWYVPEHRTPAPILISVFMRGPFRVVWNKSGALNLTAYHGIYPRISGERFAQALWRYLRSDEGQIALRRHARIYADGLYKVEPKDVEAVSIPERLIADFFDGGRRSRPA